MSPFGQMNRLYSERVPPQGDNFYLKKSGDFLTAEKKKLSPDIERAIDEYGDSLYRLCSVMLSNREDAQDAVQDCFLRYMTKAPDFNSAEHEKAWLIRTASNLCRDMLRKRKHTSFVSLDEIRNLAVSEDSVQILGLLMRLEEKQRAVMHLHYVEGYSVDELSALLGISSSAAKKRLQRGRDALRNLYEKEVRE